MDDYEWKLRHFAVDLFKIKAVKFGEFKTKIGLLTPVYCDLRVIVSHPDLLVTLSDLIIHQLKALGLIGESDGTKHIDNLCGVPYTALPIATAMSLKTGLPMVMRRKEAKDYGTKKLIEGSFNEGDRCLIVEDVVTSGSSILETVKDLIGAGLKCTDAVVLLNREQGGKKILENNGIKMHALLTLSQFMGFLKDASCISGDMVDKVGRYLEETQINIASSLVTTDRLKLSFQERAKFTKNPISTRLLNIMTEKKSNLCVAADLTKSTDILNLAEKVGPHICLFKTHIDIIHDFHPNLIKPLQEIAKAHNFLLFEDRKFSDIGKTVQLQYSEGIYQISSWAHLVTAHSVTGKGVLDGILQVSGTNQERGVFLLAETSAAGSPIDANYVKSTLKLAGDYPELITGIVCQNPLFVDKPGFLQLTPGVQLNSTGDNLSQQYNSPEKVVVENGADIAVVGRGITQSQDPGKTAEEYKSILWAAYKRRIKT